MTEMKPLTLRQAKNCEEARESVCRCRCGGLLRGSNRGGADAGSGFFESLAGDDPHYVESETAKRQRRQERADAKRREREEAQRRKWEYLARAERERYEVQREHGGW